MGRLHSPGRRAGGPRGARGWARGLMTAVVVVATLAPTSALAAEWMRCSLSASRSACCCPKPARQAAPARTPALRPTTCCQVEAAPPVEVAAREVPVATTVAAMPPVVAVAIDLPAPVPVTAPPPVASPRSSRAPPLFLQHCALLN